jgi:hypothetical protein
MKARVSWISGLVGVVMGIAALLLGSCASAQGKGAESNSPKKSRCGIGGFARSPSEHIVVERDQPFRVRTVEGVITSQGGDWPDGISVLFELRPTHGAGKLKQVKTDSRGSFKMPDVPPGDYCFKATVDGWQSVVGVIVVTEAADPAARVSFEMLLGV